MKRSDFLMGLLGLCGIRAKGQGPEPTIRKCETDGHGIAKCEDVSARSLGITGAGRGLRNGECPVCGTIAEPYVQQVFHGGAGDQQLEKPWRFVRCKTCSVVFCQDSEN